MDFSVRPVRSEDRSAVMTLAPRLRIGMSRLRDSDGVNTAVAQWLESSLVEFYRKLGYQAEDVNLTKVLE